jgi:hypothetical protein
VEYISPSYTVQIEEIMENFEWTKVHNVMKHLKWEWHSSKTEDRVPGIYELMRQAKYLLESASKYKNPGDFAATGGFHAYNYYGRLKLSFEVDSWLCEGEYNE